jgi:threonine dehydrogenase-like Zn-dependent dehydrogenase
LPRSSPGRDRPPSASCVPELARDGRVEAERLGTHDFALGEIERAYDVFGGADEHDALQVVLTG